MPDPSRRQTLLELIRTRLQGIHVNDGFFTDAGATVFLGEKPELGENDADVAIAVLVGDESGRRQGKAIFVELPIEIQALAKADLDEPWVASEQLLSDIQRAIEVEDELMHANDKRAIEIGPTRTLPREAGSSTVGLGVTYIVKFGRAWGQP